MERRPLGWTTIGPWTYALGEFGILKGVGAFSPWVVRVGARVLGVFRCLPAARQAIEAAAIESGFALAE
jgi:hypothetical protein